MGETTGIAWTNSTFNPWIGCTQVSPGCDNCYAMVQDHRWGKDSWGKGKPRRMTSDSYWKKPLEWNRLAEKEGRKHLVFCASMADVMDDEAPDGARERLWELIDETPNLIWQLLTKRPHRYHRYLPREFKYGNVWLGTTAENQEFYDIRWPILSIIGRQTKLRTWISYEPAIGPLTMVDGWINVGAVPTWMICGGESGAQRRVFWREWADGLLAECRLYGVKFFMKQMGGLTAEIGKQRIPLDLMVQEFPEY